MGLPFSHHRRTCPPQRSDAVASVGMRAAVAVAISGRASAYCPIAASRQTKCATGPPSLAYKVFARPRRGPRRETGDGPSCLADTYVYKCSAQDGSLQSHSSLCLHPISREISARGLCTLTRQRPCSCRASLDVSARDVCVLCRNSYCMSLYVGSHAAVTASRRASRRRAPRAWRRESNNANTTSCCLSLPAVANPDGGPGRVRHSQ